MHICLPTTLLVIIFVYYCLIISFNLYVAPLYDYDNEVLGTCAITETLSHCGSCGECSTLQDYNVYYETRNTLTGLAKECAIRDVFIGRDSAIECFDDTGLTPGCRDCWLENVDCDRNHCFFPCLWETTFGIQQNIDENTLSKCLACDEYYCLDIFITCAGMSRRRANITTDIGRHPTEMCT
jgi:hypothetical protein